ncbi:MAG TPA: hypothetical protein VK638_07200 [Edaphobacter sp.]|nr:hypothetical protein [Edaphobacter sp.]
MQIQSDLFYDYRRNVEAYPASTISHSISASWRAIAIYRVDTACPTACERGTPYAKPNEG